MKNEIKFPKEFILLGTDNNGLRHRYSVEKNEDFKNIFAKFMRDLGFDYKQIINRFHYTEEEQEIVVKIKNLEDVCQYYFNSEYEVDVFYGSKKIIIVIRTNQREKRDRRKKMIKDLREKSKWKEIPDNMVKNNVFKGAGKLTYEEKKNGTS